MTQILMGSFPAFPGPWGRREIRADVALYQLEQAELWRRRNGM
ncbi:hypothetical protein [Actinoplanes subglobosus]|uniref:Uncharacterized protein n=1 Tax=Actinoplanes subglobosus TaxID=1547892 RepID=A0ABV8IJE5_9ACTN